MASLDDAFLFAQSLSPSDQQILIERLTATQKSQEFTPPRAILQNSSGAGPNMKLGEWRRYPGNRFAMKFGERFHRMHSLDVLSIARAEFKEATNWYLDKSTTTAERFISEVEFAFDAIQRHPTQHLRWNDKYRY